MIKNVDYSNGIDIFNIRNDKIIRQISNNKDKLSLKKHLEWYKEKIENQKNIFKILKTEKGYIGYIRLDYLKEKQYLISIAILQIGQKKGYGKKIFEKAIEEISKGSVIYAKILDYNQVSIKFFLKLGFKRDNNKYIFIK